VRVLMVMADFLAGGAEMAALTLTRGLTRRGHRVAVAAIRRTGVLAERFARAGAAIHSPLASWRFDPAPVARLAGIIRRDRVDCVIVVGILRNGLFYACVASLLSGRRPATICWCHAMPGGQGGDFARRLRAYVSAGLLDLIVCVGRCQRDGLAALGLDRRALPIVPNGIDLSRFDGRAAAGGPPRLTDPPVPAGKRLVVQVANVMPDKDYATLIAAAAKLARVRPDVHFLFVGRGTDSPTMARTVRRAGLDGALTLAGHRDDVPGILAAADAFVLSSRSESFGLAVVEAMAAGLPVVVSDLPAFRELLADGREGLKVPPGDPEALAGAIARVLDDAALRKALAAAGRRRARRFGHARMVRRFERLLQTVCRRPARPVLTRTAMTEGR